MYTKKLKCKLYAVHERTNEQQIKAKYIHEKVKQAANQCKGIIPQ
jgi:hypothetical protein